MNNEPDKIQKEILTWIRLLGLYLLESKLLPLLLDSPEKRKVYQMTDGEQSVGEISKKTGVSFGTISNWWNLWNEKGILVKEGKRYKRLINLRPMKEVKKHE